MFLASLLKRKGAFYFLKNKREHCIGWLLVLKAIKVLRFGNVGAFRHFLFSFMPVASC